MFVFAKSGDPDSRGAIEGNGTSLSCLRKGKGRAAGGSVGLIDLRSQLGAEWVQPKVRGVKKLRSRAETGREESPASPFSLFTCPSTSLLHPFPFRP